MFKIGSQISEVRIDGNLELLRKDLDEFCSIGLDAVEIPPHGLDVIKNGRLDRMRLKAVRDILAQYDFTYTVHGPNPMNLMDEERSETHQNVFRSSLAFTQEIGASVMVYHAGRYVPEEAFYARPKNRRLRISREHLWECETRLLGELADECPEVCIGIENARPYLHDSPYCYAEDMDQLIALVKEVSRKNVRITMDCGHLFMASPFYGYDYVEAVRKAAPLVGHCHIHDNFGAAVYYNEKQQTHQIPFGKGDSHMPVGWGAIPLQDVLGELIPPYGGCFIMELRPRYFQETAQSRDNLIGLFTALNEK